MSVVTSKLNSLIHEALIKMETSSSHFAGFALSHYLIHLSPEVSKYECLYSAENHLSLCDVISQIPNRNDFSDIA